MVWVLAELTKIEALKQNVTSFFHIYFQGDSGILP